MIPSKYIKKSILIEDTRHVVYKTNKNDLMENEVVKRKIIKKSLAEITSD